SPRGIFRSALEPNVSTQWRSFREAPSTALRLPSPREQSEWWGGIGDGGNEAEFRPPIPTAFGGRPSPPLRGGRVQAATLRSIARALLYRRSALLGAVARRDLVIGRVLRRGVLDHRIEDGE